MRSVPISGLLAACMIFAAAGWVRAEFPVQLEVLHTNATSIPGVPAANIIFISLPVLNHHGDILFAATVFNSGAPIRSNNTLLLNRDGLLSVAIQGGVDAPGAGQTIGDFFDPPVMNANGDIVFRSQLLTGSTTTGHGVFRVFEGQTQLIAYDAMEAPQTEAGTQFPSFVLNYTDLGIGESGDVVFRSTLEGPSITNLNDTGLWSFSDGMLTQIAREGGAAPVGLGVNYVGNPADVYFQPVAFTAGGRVAFTAGLAGSGITTSNDTALLLGGVDGVQVIVQEGDPAVGPGLPEDAAHSLPALQRIALNDSGEVLFASFLSGSGINTSNDLTVWKHTMNELRLLLRENEQVEGAPDGVLLSTLEFSQIGRGAAMNSHGDFVLTVFLKGAGVTGSNDYALYGDVGGQQGLILREGDPVPGLPGLTFASSFTTTFMINGRGDVFIRTAVTGPGVTTANNETLWFWTAEHGLQLIFREGNTVQFATGAFPVGVTTLPAYCAGDDDARGIIFNNRGQLVLNTFVNGSAAIVRATLQRPVVIEWEPVGFFGGQPNMTSANYAVDSSMDPVAGRPGNSMRFVARSGFAGQLADAVGLDSSPLGDGAESSEIQLTAALEMDDGTLTRLPPGAARWISKSGPLAAVTTAGLASISDVFEDSEAEFGLRYRNFQTTRTLTVLDTIQDNFAEYGGDALPDDWQVANFGLPPNDRAASLADPDGNGQTNMLEFLAGTNPNDPNSRFVVESIPPTVPGVFSLRIGKVIPGTKYTVLRNNGLASEGWDPLQEISVTVQQNDYIVTDNAPFPDKSFYQIILEKE